MRKSNGSGRKEAVGSTRRQRNQGSTMTEYGTGSIAAAAFPVRRRPPCQPGHVSHVTAETGYADRYGGGKIQKGLRILPGL